MCIFPNPVFYGSNDGFLNRRGADTTCTASEEEAVKFSKDSKADITITLINSKTKIKERETVATYDQDRHAWLAVVQKKGSEEANIVFWDPDMARKIEARRVKGKKMQFGDLNQAQQRMIHLNKWGLFDKCGVWFGGHGMGEDNSLELTLLALHRAIKGGSEGNRVGFDMSAEFMMAFSEDAKEEEKQRKQMREIETEMEGFQSALFP